MKSQEDQKEITIIEPLMDANEARECVQQINNSAAEMGRMLLELKLRKGWKALGYRNWSELLRNEFSHSRKRLYELMKAAPIIENFVTQGLQINAKQANALAQFPEQLRPTIVNMTQTRYGSLTKSRIERVGETLLQAERTGYVDIGDGSVTVPFDERIDSERTALGMALDLSDQEARKRQWAYMNEGVRHISFKTINELATRLSSTLDAAELQQLATLLNAKVKAEFS